MATTGIGVEEYLRMSFDGPDREYVDGEILERNVGERPHSKAQKRILVFFAELEKSRPVYCFPELRVQVAPSRCRVPDLAVFAGVEPAENVPSNPPLVVVEIVSRDDRYVDLLEKCEDYRQWGVTHIWLVDPWLRKLYAYGSAGLSEAPALPLPEFDVEIPASAIF